MTFLKKYSKKLIYIAISIIYLFSLSLFAQEKKIIIYGKILDSNTNPIENVNIKIKNKAIGTVSNYKGIFLLKNVNKKDSLIISHLSYEKKIVYLKKHHNNNDTILLSISLNPIIEKISDVVVTAKKQLQKIASQQIYDYTFIQNDIVLLNTDINGLYLKKNDIKSKLFIKSNKANFLIDILGNIHIQTRDSVYQIELRNNKFHILNIISIKKYENELEPFKALTDSIMLLEDLLTKRNYRLHQQLHKFYIINLRTKKKTPLINLFDKENYLYSKSYYNSVLKCYYKVTPKSQNIIEMGMWDGNINTLNAFDPELIQEIEWYSRIASIPIYTPVIQYNNKFFIFDFSNKYIYNFDTNGKKIKQVHFKISKTTHIEKELLFDLISHKTYLKTIKNGFVKLLSIDKENGEITHSVAIPHRFPKKIKINNKFVYYIVENTKFGEHDTIYRILL